jgi:phage repressor protein C with HTH and peptisase S24 domain
MTLAQAAERLRAGEVVVMRVHGHSMTPRIRDGDRVRLYPLKGAPNVGDAVLAKVRGRYMLHLVTAIRGDEFQISNNKGHVNGWTRQVFGIVAEVLP